METAATYSDYVISFNYELLFNVIIFSVIFSIMLLIIIRIYNKHKK